MRHRAAQKSECPTPYWSTRVSGKNSRQRQNWMFKNLVIAKRKKWISNLIPDHLSCSDLRLDMFFGGVDLTMFPFDWTRKEGCFEFAWSSRLQKDNKKKLVIAKRKNRIYQPVGCAPFGRPQCDAASHPRTRAPRAVYRGRQSIGGGSISTPTPAWLINLMVLLLLVSA